MFVHTEPNGSQACCAVQALIRDAGEQGAQGSPRLPSIEFASRSAFRMREHRLPAGQGGPPYRFGLHGPRGFATAVLRH